MKISEALSVNSIETGQKYHLKSELIDALLNLAQRSGNISDMEEAKRQVMKREDIMSTGIGNGLAIPHAKTAAVSRITAALITLSEPLDYDSLDGEDINLAFLLLGDDKNVGLHLRLLSKVSRLLNNDSFYETIRQASDPREIYALFRQYDEEV